MKFIINTSLEQPTLSCHIPWEIFELLTGHRQLQTSEANRPREIEITRERGHIKIQDYKFIINEKYKKDGHLYTCRIVSGEDGLALLEPSSSKLEFLSSKDPMSMEVA
jgi:hypothetical protein